MRAEIVDLPMDLYVRDAFAPLAPSLSSSVAHALLTTSPKHAWQMHARLNPAWTPDSPREYDLGTACHAVLLEGKPLEVLAFKDYRTDKAKATRDDVIAAGGIPVLTKQADAITNMIASVRAKLAACQDLRDLGDLLAERTCLWQHDGARMRCRPDWMTADHAVILSLKTTAASAEPNAFLRTLVNSGYHTQAAFELAGVKAATGIDPAYVWIAVETDPPYECSLTGMTPAFREFAMVTVHRAARTWAECLERDAWPAYPDRICYLDPPPWVEAQFMERHGYDAGARAVVDDGRPLADQLFGDPAITEDAR